MFLVLATPEDMMTANDDDAGSERAVVPRPVGGTRRHGLGDDELPAEAVGGPLYGKRA